MNALLVAHHLSQSRGPLPPRTAQQIPRHQVELGKQPSPSQVVHAPMPPRLTAAPHGAPVPASNSLPGVIVRVGPAGGDAAQAHLRAGHSPDELAEAAAHSLAHAAMVHGRLDPAGYAEWVERRLHFLAHIPNAGELFSSVEAAERTIQTLAARTRAAGNRHSRPDRTSASPSTSFPSNGSQP